MVFNAISLVQSHLTLVSRAHIPEKQELHACRQPVPSKVRFASDNGCNPQPFGTVIFMPNPTRTKIKPFEGEAATSYA